jgi:hypothetical protein
MAGILGFFNRKTPRILSKLDRFYQMFSQMTRIFHWEVIIEAFVPPSSVSEVLQGKPVRQERKFGH